VLQAFIYAAENYVGNPSSTHAEGRVVRSALMQVRETIAEYLGVRSKEIIFTSGGTEAINMVVRGIFACDGSSKKGHIITSNVEHPALLESVQWLERQGVEASYLSPGATGALQPPQVLEAIRPNTRLIALMAVNNETGVKTNIEEIADLAKKAHIPFVVDGVALLGKEHFSIPDGVSAMFFSGHKLHAPKGVGFVYLRSRLKFFPFLTGGSQEFNKRAGSENLPAIIALAKAVSLLEEELPNATHHMQYLRDKLENTLRSRVPEIIVNGQGARIANTTNLSFVGYEGEMLLAKLDLAGIAVSHGSACSSGSLQPSRILQNMGIAPEVAAASLRFSLSRFTTEQEIDHTLDILLKLFDRKNPTPMP